MGDAKPKYEPMMGEDYLCMRYHDQLAMSERRAIAESSKVGESSKLATIVENDESANAATGEGSSRH